MDLTTRFSVNGNVVFAVLTTVYYVIINNDSEKGTLYLCPDGSDLIHGPFKNCVLLGVASAAGLNCEEQQFNAQALGTGWPYRKGQDCTVQKVELSKGLVTNGNQSSLIADGLLVH